MKLVIFDMNMYNKLLHVTMCNVRNCSGPHKKYHNYVVASQRKYSYNDAVHAFVLF